MKDTYLKKILGDECFNKVRSARLLLVGAGGLGCELLKDLVLSGYGEIHIVDLDTITLSNLNRQFLFRKTDIGKSKSLTVSKTVEGFNYLGTKLVAHHGNIMDTTKFPLEWWQQFDYVYMALDNAEARTYVNCMCLLLKKTYMDSGTEGYRCHLTAVTPYVTSCFDCKPPVPRKTYPVCTIRSTPSLPVHCITWAREFLFNQLFDERESDLNDTEAIARETDNDDEIKNLTQEANELAELRERITHGDVFFAELVNKIYNVDIERLLRIEALWESRRPPTPLVLDQDAMQKVESSVGTSLLDTKVWSLAENLYALYVSCGNLQRRLKKEEDFISFDKDDDDAMLFVAAASNLRSHVFHIETKSLFDIKEIAGNIIPAIATTNAFISGFASAIGTQLFRDSNAGYILHGTNAPKYAVISAPPEPPSPECPSCSARREVLYVSKQDFDSLTLQWLVDQLTPLYNSDISIQVGKSKLIYDVDFDDYLLVSLSQVPGLDVILVQDDSDRLQNLILHLVVGNETRFPSVELKEKPLVVKSDSLGNSDGDDDDDFAIIDGDTVKEDSSDIEIIEPAAKRQHKV